MTMTPSPTLQSPRALLREPRPREAPEPRSVSPGSHATHPGSPQGVVQPGLLRH